MVLLKKFIVKSVSQGNGISCKPPNEYSKRFVNFVEKILNTDIDDIKKNNIYKKDSIKDEKYNSDESIKNNINKKDSIKDEEYNGEDSYDNEK